MVRNTLRALFLAAAAAVLVAPAKATWSIVVLNRVTGEVAVATSTCIANFDISNAVPVIRVGYAAGAAQSFVNFQAVNRRIIYRNSLRGATPQELLDRIEATDGGFQTRQFGIVTFTGPPVSHTGSSNGAAASGVTGEVGDLQYAIQGNVLTGAAVISACEAAFVMAPGDLGEKIMAAMEAARDAGGDGRCSCSNNQPTACGSPPPSFTYASYNAFMAVARLGDTDAPCLGSTGCADGDYFLKLNYVGGPSTQEPIAALRGQYDAWRAALVGRPDQLRSEMFQTVPQLQADGVTASRVTLVLRDIDGNPLLFGGQAVTVQRVGGPMVASVQNLVDNGDGTHSFDLVATALVGEAQYRVVVDDGIRPVQLSPDLTVTSIAPADFHLGSAIYSAAEGTTLPFFVAAGAANAGAPYRVLGSLSGTSPGTGLGLATVPLNRDRLFDAMLTWPGGPPFEGNAGMLDASGRSSGAFFAAPGALGGFVGSTLSFAAAYGTQDATAPASVLIAP